MPVSRLISDKIPVTMYLAVITLIVIVIISIPLGVFMARFGHRKVSKIFDIVNQSVMAVPSFS